jgi:hypothetical protein
MLNEDFYLPLYLPLWVRDLLFLHAYCVGSSYVFLEASVITVQNVQKE